MLLNVHWLGCVVDYSLNVTQKRAHRWLQQSSGSSCVLLTKHRKRSVDKHMELSMYCRIYFRLYNGTELMFVIIIIIAVVGLWLDANIWEPYQCSCQRIPRGIGWLAGHHSLNNLVWRALAKANIPSIREPCTKIQQKVTRQPDTNAMWKWQVCVTCDVTDTLMQSYCHPHRSRLVVQRRPRRKRLMITTRAPFFFQCLSMTIQRFSAVTIQGTFAMHTPTEVNI